MATKSWDSGYQDLLSLTILWPWNLEELRPACACCLKLFMAYASSQPWQCDNHKANSVQTGNYCSNNHLLVPMHIYTRWCHILFMHGTCFMRLLLTLELNLDNCALALLANMSTVCAWIPNAIQPPKDSHQYLPYSYSHTVICIPTLAPAQVLNGWILCTNSTVNICTRFTPWLHPPDATVPAFMF